MSYGLQIVNESGYVQIDENYANYSLVASGYGTTGTVVMAGMDLTDCLVFIRIPTNVWATTDGGIDSGDRFVIATTRGSSNFPFEYRVYKYVMALPATTGYTLQVYRGDGSLCFDGNRAQTRVISVSNYPVGSGAVITIPSVGFNPWVLANTMDFVKMVMVNSSLSKWYTLGFRVNTNFTIEVGEVLMNTLPFGISVPVTNGNSTILVAR